MPANFLSKESAMRILGVSKATIYRYLRNGKLRPAFQGKHIGVWDDEVKALKRQLDDPLPVAMNRVTLAQILSRLQAAENTISVLCRVLDIRHEALKMADTEYLTLYKMAETWGDQGWFPQIEEQMADTFVRMRLEDLEKFEAVTQDPHPWRPLLKFARSLQARSYNSNLRDQFSAGVNNLMSLAGVFTVMKGESAKDCVMMMETDAMPNKKLMKKMAKEAK